MTVELEQPEPGERWPVIRTNTTRTLHRWVWRSIAERDNWSCRICHKTDQGDGWEIDHIIPWSAGGTDETTNLRLTCRECNQTRSNYADPFARPMPPVIDRCQPDYGDEPCNIRVWCSRHNVYESAPTAYAEQYELSRRLPR